MYNSDVEPSNTNSPIAFFKGVGTEEQSSPLPDNDIQLVNLFEQIDLLSFPISFFQLSPYSGGYSIGVPPLPIPNREVKPNHVDGTALIVGE